MAYIERNILKQTFISLPTKAFFLSRNIKLFLLLLSLEKSSFWTMYVGMDNPAVP